MEVVVGIMTSRAMPLTKAIDVTATTGSVRDPETESIMGKLHNWLQASMLSEGFFYVLLVV